jgi:hypothetical protein
MQNLAPLRVGEVDVSLSSDEGGKPRDIGFPLRELKVELPGRFAGNFTTD